MPALDELLRAQRAQQTRKKPFSDKTKLLLLSSLAILWSFACIVVAHHFFTILALIFEHQGIAFSIITTPVAFTAGLLRLDFRSTIILVACALVASTIALIIALSRFHGWAVIYDLANLDFQNAFYQYPNVLLNIIVAIFFSLAAWIIAVAVMDYYKPNV